MHKDYKIEFEIKLIDKHKPTGKTVHRLGSEVLPHPKKLCIISIAGEQGRYLIYLDELGNEITDTLHDDVAKAMKQAEWEFGVLPEEWTAVTSSQAFI